MVFLRIRSDQALAGRIRAASHGTSRSERTFRILFFLWPFIFMALLWMALLFPRVLYWLTRDDPWLLMGLFLSIGLGGPMFLLLGIIFSTRRR